MDIAWETDPEINVWVIYQNSVGVSNEAAIPKSTLVCDSATSIKAFNRLKKGIIF